MCGLPCRCNEIFYNFFSCKVCKKNILPPPNEGKNEVIKLNFESLYFTIVLGLAQIRIRRVLRVEHVCSTKMIPIQKGSTELHMHFKKKISFCKYTWLGTSLATQ